MKTTRVKILRGGANSSSHGRCNETVYLKFYENSKKELLKQKYKNNENREQWTIGHAVQYNIAEWTEK